MEQYHGVEQNIRSTHDNLRQADPRCDAPENQLPGPIQSLRAPETTHQEMRELPGDWDNCNYQGTIHRVWCKPGWPKKLVSVTFYKYFDVRFDKHLNLTQLLVKTHHSKRVFNSFTPTVADMRPFLSSFVLA